MFEANELRAVLARNGKTMSWLAHEIGVNPTSLWRKMSGTSDFTRSEVSLIKDGLNLSDDDMNRIFFAHPLT